MSPQQLLEVQQIIDLFPHSYVLVDHCKFSEESTLTHGRVVHASEDREEVYRAMREHPNSLVIFTGPRSSDLDGAYLDRGKLWEAVHTA